MPRTNPLGVTYLPGETLWGPPETPPDFSVSPNHVWAATGRTTPSGPVDMWEYKVVHVNALVDPEAEKKAKTKKTITAAAVVGAAWWLLG